MEEVKRVKVTHTTQLEAVPELIHHIQSLLPVKEAARTCVLSKSWLHALSTNPTLRQSYSFVNKWIRQMVSKSSITEIYLKLYIYTYEFHLSDEIFTSDNLKKLLESKFPFLESLNFKFKSSSMDNLDIKCVSLKRLAIKVRQRHPICVHVFAPELITFRYTGGVTIHSFLFSAIPPKQVELNLKLKMPIDMSFFLNLRETLNLSSKFNVKISTSCELIKQFNVDIDDLRVQVPYPALNVQQLSFGACPGEDLWGQSEFFDSFFSICSPGYITTYKSIGPTWKILK
ncbi:F-box protein-like protein [Tanacetum coccineum]